MSDTFPTASLAASRVNDIKFFDTRVATAAVLLAAAKSGQSPEEAVGIKGMKPSKDVLDALCKMRLLQLDERNKLYTFVGDPQTQKVLEKFSISNEGYLSGAVQVES